MSTTLDERARAASDALHGAVELRTPTVPASRRRAPARVLVTAALLVVVIAVAAVFALRAASPRNGGVADQPPSGGYRATAILVTRGPVTSNTDSQYATRFATRLRTDARLLRTGAVPARARKALHFNATAAELASELEITVDGDAGTITIASRQATGAEATRFVEAFGAEFLRHFTDLARADYASRVAHQLEQQRRAQAQLATATRQLNALKALGHDDPQLESEVQMRSQNVRMTSDFYEELVSEGPLPIEYRLIAPTSVTPLPAPRSRAANHAIAIAVAVVVALLLLGMGFVLGRRRRGPAAAPGAA